MYVRKDNYVTLLQILLQNLENIRSQNSKAYGLY